MLSSERFGFDLFGFLLLLKSAVPDKNFVNSVLDEIEILFIFNLSEKTEFHCVFEINIWLFVFFLLGEQ